MAILCFSGLAILLIKDLAPLFDMNAKEMPIYTMVVRLHRWLFMKPENAHEGGQSLGRILTAVSAICMSIVLLSGVVIWWPKTKKALKTRLTVSTNKGFRRFVYDSHVSLGIYVFIFLFLSDYLRPLLGMGEPTSQAEGWGKKQMRGRPSCRSLGGQGLALALW